jgi:cell pole-organizing protein PopZ
MSKPGNPVEQSMEEILASIRKIIAEEPIGSRPGPTPPEMPARSDGHVNGEPSPPIGRPSVVGPSLDELVDVARGAGRASAGDRVEERPNGTPGSGAGRWTLSNPFGARSSSHDAAEPPRLEGEPNAGSVKPVEQPQPVLASLRSDTVAAAGVDRGSSAPRGAESPNAAGEMQSRVGASDLMSEVRAKIERHLSSGSSGRSEEVERAPAPLGLKSIRDFASDTEAGRKPVANGLVARMTAAGGVQDAFTRGEQERPPAYSSPSTSTLFRDAMAAASRPEQSAQATRTVAETAAAAQPERQANEPAPQQAMETDHGGGSDDSVPPPSAPKAGEARTLEDTVAELLRPMLRQWLDANLPGIIERTLRAEMAEAGRGAGDKAGST